MLFLQEIEKFFANKLEFSIYFVNSMKRKIPQRYPCLQFKVKGVNFNTFLGHYYDLVMQQQLKSIL